VKPRFGRRRLTATSAVRPAANVSYSLVEPACPFFTRVCTHRSGRSTGHVATTPECRVVNRSVLDHNERRATSGAHAPNGVVLTRAAQSFEKSINQLTAIHL
jgi:hypothetical protein